MDTLHWRFMKDTRQWRFVMNSKLKNKVSLIIMVRQCVASSINSSPFLFSSSFSSLQLHFFLSPVSSSWLT